MDLNYNVGNNTDPVLISNQSNTTGIKRFLYYQGDGTSNANHQIAMSNSADTALHHTYFNVGVKAGSYFAICKTTPTTDLDVAGVISTDTGINSVTNAELTQIANIDSVSISNSQWSALGSSISNISATFTFPNAGNVISADTDITVTLSKFVNLCTCDFSGMLVASDASTNDTIESSDALNSNYRPASTKYFNVAVYDSSSLQTASVLLKIHTDGIMTFYKGLDQSNFTADSSNVGFLPSCVSYYIS